MIKAKWSQIAGACRAVESMAGGDACCWVEHAGDVVAGERPDRLVTPVSARVGGTDGAEVVAFISGRNGHAWIELLSTWVRADLAQQTTIADMAAATARTWRQMNALLAMASSSKLGLEPGKTIQRIFDMLVRSTRFDGGIAIVRLPGGDDCIQLDASGVQRVPLDMVAGLEAVGESVHTFHDRRADDEIHRACTALLEPYAPAAVARLQTDSDRFGWLVAAAAETLPSDDLKLFGAAARIIATALENSHTLSLERAATRLEVEREMYHALAKTAPVGLFRADADGRVLYVSERWCQVTGASEAEALRDGWLCAVHPGDLARVTAEWEEMLVEGTPVRCEHRCRREDDAWVLTEVAREARDDGGFVGTMTDVTDRKRAERGKAELEAHFRHAQKMEAVGTMAGGIAHDFNNILGAIVGNAELAIDRIPEEDRARVHLDRLLQGAFRARDLVRQLLAFSRQTEVVRVPQEMGAVVEEALGLIRASVPSTIEIVPTLRARGGVVSADATQLHQTVINLCTNAYQAIGDAPGEVEIRLERVVLEGEVARAAGAPARAGAYVRLSVIDSGPGISDEVRGRIFDPFFTTKGARGGSGMGLAVVHGIVSDHGGFLDVSNEPGRGARFDVYFPESDAPGGEAAASAEVDAAVSIAAASVHAAGGASASPPVYDEHGVSENGGALVPVSAAALAAARTRGAVVPVPARARASLRLGAAAAAVSSAGAASLPSSARRRAIAAPEPLDDAIEAPVCEIEAEPLRRGEPQKAETPAPPAPEDGVNPESLENLVAQFLAEEGGDPTSGDTGAPRPPAVLGAPGVPRSLEADPAREGLGAALRSRLGLSPEQVAPAADDAPAANDEADSAGEEQQPSIVAPSRDTSSVPQTRAAAAASARACGAQRAAAAEKPVAAAGRAQAPSAAQPKRASAPQDDSAFGDEDLLERLVAEFLAKEGADDDGELSAEAVEAIEGELDTDSYEAGTPAPAPARASTPARDRRRAEASGTTLPAVRGAGLPARSRLLERAPELRRGHARLLGAGAAKPRIALDAPAAAAPGRATSNEAAPETPPDSTDAQAASESDAGAQSASDMPQPPQQAPPAGLTVPLMFGLPLG